MRLPDSLDISRLAHLCPWLARAVEVLSHSNIVKILGFVEDMERKVVWLVFPWADNGDSYSQIPSFGAVGDLRPRFVSIPPHYPSTKPRVWLGSTK